MCLNAMDCFGHPEEGYKTKTSSTNSVTLIKSECGRAGGREHKIH